MSTFTGYCRYKSSTGQQAWGKLIWGLTADSSDDCYKKCKSYGEKTEKHGVCSAFSFEPKETKNCDLYKDGPYTGGDDRTNTTCYLMAKGKYTHPSPKKFSYFGLLDYEVFVSELRTKMAQNGLILAIFGPKSFFCYRTPNFVNGPFVTLCETVDLAPLDRFLKFSFPSYGPKWPKMA